MHGSAAAIRKPEVQQRLGALGVELVGSTAAEMHTFLAREAVKDEDAEDAAADAAHPSNPDKG